MTENLCPPVLLLLAIEYIMYSTYNTNLAGERSSGEEDKYVTHQKSTYFQFLIILSQKTR
jgi:hypothetical protein